MSWLLLQGRVSLLVLIIGVASWANADEWAQFRGPGNAGVVNSSGSPTEWSVEKNVAWKVAIPGVAWSSPVVWGDKVFVTTAVSDKQEKPKPGMGGGGGPGGRGNFPPRDGAGPRPRGDDDEDRPPGGQPNADGPRRGPGRGGFGRGGGAPPDATYRWEVHCLDRTSGKTLWKQVADEHKPTIPIHRTNTYASETPVTDGQHVYAYFGMTGLFCFDVDGKLVWKKELPSYPMQHGWGTGSSPALDGDLLFVQCDNEKQSYLAAFNKLTGEEKWRVDREPKSSWGTPFIWRAKGRTEIVACGGGRVQSYDAATGKVLWHLDGLSGNCNATPVANTDMLFVGSGGPMGDSPLYAIHAGADGDISLKGDEKSNAGVAWSRKRSGPSMASPLLYQDLLYVLEQRGGMISCYHAKTGEPAYSKKRIEGATGFTSSPWAHDGKVFCLDQDGQTTVLKAGSEFEVVGQNKIGEMCWSSPAFASNELLLRGVDHLFCIR